MEKKFSYMRSLSDFLVEEKIPFVAVGVSYNFEGRVDRRELHTGDFTYSETLLLIGYTEKFGKFKVEHLTRTGIPSNKAGFTHFPSGDELVAFLGNLKNIKSIT